MHAHTIEFLKADIKNRWRLAEEQALATKLELDTALAAMAQEMPRKDQSCLLVLEQHAEQAKHFCATAASEMESLADLIRSLKRCDC